MKQKSTTVVGLDAVIEGREAYIEFVRTSVWVEELYGADADGNRGMWTWFLDEDDATDISVLFDDDPLRKSWLEELTLPQQTAVEDAIEAYLDMHEPEDTDVGEPDPDDMRDRYLDLKYEEDLM